MRPLNVIMAVGKKYSLTAETSGLTFCLILDAIRNCEMSTETEIFNKIQGVPCARGLGFVDLDLECSTTLLGQ